MQLNEANPLEQFVLLAKGARGAAAVQLIQQALSNPGVYVFGELLNCPTIQELENSPETACWWKLLQIFGFGTFSDFVNQRSELPTLNEFQIKKLQQLTICTLAAQQKRISYKTLLEHTHVNNVRELEDLIIDAVYNDLLQGKLDQRLQLLEIERCCGRDVRDEQIPNLIRTMSEWSDQCQSLLKCLDREIIGCNQRRLESLNEQKELDLKVTQLRKQLKLGNQTVATEYDDLPAEVSSSASPHPPGFSDTDRKKDKKPRFGLRGSGSRLFNKKD